MQIYLSAPVFSQMQRRWNREFATLLRKRMPECEVALPQDFKVRGKYNDRQRFGELFQRCIEAIDAADAVVALLDGADSDSGVAFEVGLAYAAGKPVVGVRTDYRQNQERGLNMMLSKACCEVVCRMAFQEDPQVLVEEVAQKLLSAFKRTDT